jgi:hypothetical protein
MSGRRLWIGLVAMGIIVPLVIGYIIKLDTFGEYFAVAIPSFFGWCIVDFIANVMSRPRLENRTARGAIREYRGDDEAS